jgi:hypothetical protein
MHRRATVLLAALAFLPAAPLLAQGNSQCSAYIGPDKNICNAAIDGAVLFHPVAGMLVSGGNPTLGQVGTLGGFPHLTLSARVNATKFHLPDLNYNGTGTTVASADEVVAPAPQVEAALGLFKGMGNGLLAIDLLGSAQLLPTNQIDNFSVDKDATSIGDVALGFGFGARVGVTNQMGAIPAIAVSAMHRSIPEVTYGDVSQGNQYRYGVDLDATNLRAMAGYSLGLVSVGGGLGWDKYTGKADIEFNPTVGPTQFIAKDLDQERTLAFLDAGLNFGMLNLVGEVGWQFGKDLNLSTTFEDNDPKDNRLFGSAALRFTF